MGFDVDDVGSVCVAHALQDLGEAEILAIVHDTGFKPGVGALSSIANWYDHNDIPMGAYKGKFASSSSSFGAQNNYATNLISDMPGPIKDYDAVPSALEVLRKTLAAQPDNSVVISSVGMTTNMRDLI